ncbi:uncharacterized protein LOC110857199 isoform X2 [Folsomia candida]|uniref:uncharacterized protein LOC110857199 isoform X2 n=1 Tax=Folsomia candida TaxID=158441 RepID=UPI001604CD1B|nr:uncharacterized protein LOC110857199 isoform X2 [Folsomia candida]
MQVESDLSTQEMDEDVVTSATMNPLLLNLIFSYLDAPTLKASVRPVCTLWADLGAPFLGKKTTLTFSELMTCDMETPKAFGLATFHPKLAKNVKLVSSKCPCESPERLPRKFTAARPKIARYLEELEVKIYSSFLPGLHKLWRSKSHLFENLTKISITVLLSSDENQGTILTASYPTMANVRVILIKMTNQYETEQDEMAASICQKLLNSTPNLTEMEVEASFYLDFAPSKKLSKLTYAFVQFFDWDTEEPPGVMEIGKMAKMLESCRESLTELSLSHVGEKIDDEEDDDMPQPQTLSLPSFTSLTRLSISSMEVYRLGDCLSATHLPNLTHVSLAGCVQLDFTLSDIFANLLQPHVGITSLDLDAVYDGDEHYVDIGTEIIRVFPAVKMLQLKLTISVHLLVENYDDIRLLKKTLRNFAPWELTSAVVQIHKVRSSGVVLGTMQGLRRWKGLAHTEVRLYADKQPFVLGEILKEVLLACREIKLLKMLGFLMKNRDEYEFQEFIEENSLPITFSE